MYAICTFIHRVVYLCRKTYKSGKLQGNEDSQLFPEHPPEKYTLHIKNTFPTSSLPSILIRFKLCSGKK